MMSRVVTAVVFCLLVAAPAAAQNHPTRLATLFEDIYGPNGLVLSSEDVTLDGSNHAAHFNSAFQSEFRLVNIALTSQLAAIPLPSPGSGFTYKFDDASGTFVRSARSFGPRNRNSGAGLPMITRSPWAVTASMSSDRISAIWGMAPSI